MKFRGFDNAAKLTDWFNRNLIPTANVNIVWINHNSVLVLFYREADELKYAKSTLPHLCQQTYVDGFD